MKKVKILVYLLAIALLYFALFYRIILVQGNSMYPTLHNDQICIAKCTNEINDNDIVVLYTGDILECNYIVKRFIKEKSTEDQIWIEGDNRYKSYDSKNFGLLDRDRVKFKIIYIF